MSKSKGSRNIFDDDNEFKTPQPTSPVSRSKSRVSTMTKKAAKSPKSRSTSRKRTTRSKSRAASKSRRASKAKGRGNSKSRGRSTIRMTKASTRVRQSRSQSRK